MVIDTSREDTKPSTETPISDHPVHAESLTDEKPLSRVASGLPSLPVDSNQSSPPPSRMRIYFHTPVTPDDARPIPHSSHYYGDSSTTSDVRKGKRKKLEDDDGDLEQGRAAPPPPPQMDTNGFGNVDNATSLTDNDRSSVPASLAPSLPDTLSEDWLMAAIVEGEEEAEAEGVLRPPHDEENLNDNSEVLDFDDQLVPAKQNHDEDKDDDAAEKACGEHNFFRSMILVDRAFEISPSCVPAAPNAIAADGVVSRRTRLT